jgi:hypothetical protein
VGLLRSVKQPFAKVLHEVEGFFFEWTEGLDAKWAKLVDTAHAGVFSPFIQFAGLGGCSGYSGC